MLLSINLISKDSKTPLNIFIHNYLPLINSIYFQFWYIKDKLFRYLIYISKNIHYKKKWKKWRFLGINKCIR